MHRRRGCHWCRGRARLYRRRRCNWWRAGGSGGATDRCWVGDDEEAAGEIVAKATACVADGLAVAVEDFGADSRSCRKPGDNGDAVTNVGDFGCGGTHG